MRRELLLIQGTQPDMGLQNKAASLARDGNLILRILSVAKMEESIADDAQIAKRLVSETKEARVILAPASVRLRNIMPMLAWYLQAGLTADCTQLEISEAGELIQTRPAFGNSLMATIKTGSDIQMATVRPGTFPAREWMERVVEVMEGNSVQVGVKQLEYMPFLDTAPIGQASVVVAGGAGVGSKEGFAKLAKLAKKLNGAVGASRSAVDAGFAPYVSQVGITGVTVCPRLYIAIGISGAVQHLSGMSGSAMVVAINSDPKAPIFDYADYGIVGDWEIIVDQLLEELS